MNTSENNSLIAEFMGLPLVDGVYKNNYEVMSVFKALGYSREPDELEFHSSWDWLMPVVEKIESLDYSVDIDRGWTTISDQTDRDGFVLIQQNSLIKIESVYSTIIEFIKWYNENK